MRTRPLVTLFVAYLLLGSVANGLGALWPVYIAQLGGGPAFTGYYTAVGTLAMTIGTVAAGALADRTQRRRLLFVLACGLLIVCMLLFSRVQTLLQLTLVNFAGGIATGAGYALVTIMGGLLAGSAERGRVFGILTLAMNASLLVGGLASGPIADRWGFPALFLVSAAVCGAALVTGLFLHDVRVAKVSQARTLAGRRRALFRPSFILLLGSAFFGSLAWLAGRLGLFVAMSELGFAATAISLSSAVGAIVSLPVPLVLGRLSDRAGRRRLMVGCYLAGLAGLVVLAWAQHLAGFWVASALNSVLYVSTALASALVTDIAPRELLDLGLSWLWGVTNLGTVIGSPATGLGMQYLGQRNTFLVALLAPLAAIVLLLGVRDRRDVSVTEGATAT
jgi:MFS family permease